VLKELIKIRGIKQRFIAQKLGVSEVTVSNWVKEKTYPTDENWVKLAALLDTSVEKLKQGKW
jgi:plasmid maintenance system antidote protein VapI